MNTINKYLQYLNEGKNYKDGNIPNPYDYQSIDLDPKVTKQDLKILGRWLKKNKKFFDPDMPLDPYIWLYWGNYEDYKKWPDEPGLDEPTFTILDKNKRVGIVRSDSSDLTWVSWVPNRNYALRGTMKMIEKYEKENKEGHWKYYKSIDKKNIPSLKVARQLKMKMLKIHVGGIDWGPKRERYDCTIERPYWWIEKKKRWFRR